MNNPFVWFSIATAFIAVVFCIILLIITRKQKAAITGLSLSFDSFASNDDRMLTLKGPDLKFIYVNNAFAQFFDKPRSEIIGTDLAFVEGELDEWFKRTDLCVLSEKKALTFEKALGGRIFKITKFPVTTIDGKPGVGACFSDITAQHEFISKQEKILTRNKAQIDLLSMDYCSIEQMIDAFIDEAKALTGSREGFIITRGDIGGTSSTHIDKTLRSKLCNIKEPLYINDFACSEYKRYINQEHIKIKNMIAVPALANGEVLAVIVLANKPGAYGRDDVTELSLLTGGVYSAICKAEASVKLKRERNKYLQILISINSGVIVTDKNGIVEMQNPEAEKLTGWSANEAEGKHYFDVYPVIRSDPAHACDPIETVLTSGVSVSVQNNIILSRDGVKYNIEENAAPICNGSEITGAVLVFRDVTDIVAQRDKIEFLSFHDPLTGLYNRRFFEEEMRRLDVRRNLPLSIIMGDANGLKLTNDIFGHAFGDMLIIKAAQVFRSVCREDDIIARLDGDEFVILLPKTPRESAERIITRIKDEFSKEQIRLIKGNMSMGFDTKQDASENILDIYKNAEERMYQNKAVETEEFSASTLDTIMNNLFTLSPSEKHHAVFVSDFCVQLGRALSLTDTDLKILHEAGYYHDIGKITLEPKLLKKHVNLTEREWNEIKKHPITGYRILTRYNYTLDIAQIVLAHQERWDGCGYPKGLRYGEIPLPSRIIAIAESYERRLSGDEANPPLSVEGAQKYIVENAGTRFDPSLIDVFLQTSSAFTPAESAGGKV